SKAIPEQPAHKDCKVIPGPQGLRGHRAPKAIPEQPAHKDRKVIPGPQGLRGRRDPKATPEQTQRSRRWSLSTPPVLWATCPAKSSITTVPLMSSLPLRPFPPPQTP